MKGMAVDPILLETNSQLDAILGNISIRIMSPDQDGTLDNAVVLR